jgi:hypothetical protein
MVAEGTLRPCPKCALLTMKEYGICNVIVCERCSIWWNWTSNETGNSPLLRASDHGLVLQTMAIAVPVCCPYESFSGCCVHAEIVRIALPDLIVLFSPLLLPSFSQVDRLQS